MAAYAWHAMTLGISDETVNRFFYRGMFAVGWEAAASDLLPLVMECGEVNLRCMELLDSANIGAYGDPAPTQVSFTVEEGPFIVVSGHDLHDLYLLLEQTKDKGVNVYTHGEMLPAHAYPRLAAYPQLKGNFGTAWQNQQKEFAVHPRSHPLHHQLPHAARALLRGPGLHNRDRWHFREWPISGKRRISARLSRQPCAWADTGNPAA